MDVLQEPVFVVFGASDMYPDPGASFENFTFLIAEEGVIRFPATSLASYMMLRKTSIAVLVDAKCDTRRYYHARLLDRQWF